MTMRGNYVPFELQIEIMKGLPVKSLIRFRSVSKTWKSIIQSSQFRTDYDIQPHRDLLFVGYDFENYIDIYNDDDDNSFLQRFTLPMSPQHPRFDRYELIGYSQGLFGYHCSNHITTYKDSLVIWNPSIRKSLFIPLPKRNILIYRFHFHFTVSNATDPTIFKTSNYYMSGSQRLLVEIYSVNTGVWRNLDIVPPRETLVLTFISELVIDGFIHWFACDGTSAGVCFDKMILSFDITSEKFTELYLPPTLAAHTRISNLGFSKLRESLVVLQICSHNREVGVWMMMDPGVQNSFTKLYTVRPPNTSTSPTVLGFRNNGQPIIYYKYSSPLLVSYQPDLECFNDVKTAETKYSCLAGSFMETLLLLDD